MRALSARERRLIAVLLLVALLGVVELLAVQPVLRGFAERSRRREELAMRYDANQRLIGAIPRLRRAAERRRATTSRFVLAANDAGMADEVLRERLQHSVEAIGGEFRGAETVPVASGWAGARLAARLATPQLTTLLAALQNQTPYLLVQTLVVSADDALVTGQAAPLDVQLEVSVPLRLARAR